jgi:hypothetical protein
VPKLVASAVWRVRPDVVVAVDGRFGEPIDTYVNGSQVWLREDGPEGVMLEWRLHPVPGYRRPGGVGTDEVFSATALALADGGTPPAGLDDLWDGLEAFPAYDDVVDPQALAEAATASLGIPPDAFGLVDHERIASEWEHTSRNVSITARLLAQLIE